MSGLSGLSDKGLSVQCACAWQHCHCHQQSTLQQSASTLLLGRCDGVTDRLTNITTEFCEEISLVTII